MFQFILFQKMLNNVPFTGPCAEKKTQWKKRIRLDTSWVVVNNIKMNFYWCTFLSDTLKCKHFFTYGKRDKNLISKILFDKLQDLYPAGTQSTFYDTIVHIQINLLEEMELSRPGRLSDAALKLFNFTFSSTADFLLMK